MANLANNPEMISSKKKHKFFLFFKKIAAMNMLKGNPDMLKSMSSMLGENNPLSKYL